MDINDYQLEREIARRKFKRVNAGRFLCEDCQTGVAFMGMRSHIVNCPVKPETRHLKQEPEV